MTQYEIDNLIARFKESIDRAFAEMIDVEDDTQADVEIDTTIIHFRKD